MIALVGLVVGIVTLVAVENPAEKVEAVTQQADPVTNGKRLLS